MTKLTSLSSKEEWQISFQGTLAGANQAQINIDTSGVTTILGTIGEIETTTTQGSGVLSEIQTVALSNATGGTFRIAFGGQVTSPLAYNASQSTVDSALEALSTVGSGNVTVSLAGSTYTVTFGGALASTNVALLQADVSTATYGTVSRTISTTYNANSQVTQVTDPSATIDYTLDNLSRATSLVNTINGLTPTVTFDQTFSAGSDRTQLKAKISSTNDFKTDYTYDTLGRMTDIVQQSNSGNTVASKHVTLAYNKLHQFTTLNRYESTSTSNQVASTDYGYDSLHRLTDLDHKQGGTTLNAYDYTYDYASRMTSVTSTADGATNYTNDKTNQLTGSDFTGQTDETYTFDDNGNRIGGSYTVGANNLTSTDGTYNYTYDDEGNRTRRTKISDSSYEDYSWDYRNRLTGVTFKNSGGTTLKTVVYEYDAFNRMIRRTYDADGPGAGAAVDAFWAFDEGINPLLEFDANTSADVSHRYLWGPQVDQLLADEQVTSTSSAGNILWALSDNLGSVRDIADLSGGTTTVTNHRRFGAYGNLVSESNSAVDLVFAFTGKFADEVTGLQNNLNRWYDGKLGQWVSEDPIGFKAGDTNVRRYVGNNPILRLDSFGLAGTLVLPDGPNLPPEWVVDPTHRYPHGTRFRHPNGDWLDWHPGREGQPGWGGRNHWHWNGGKEHLKPGTEIQPGLIGPIDDHNNDGDVPPAASPPAAQPPSQISTDPQDDRWSIVEPPLDQPITFPLLDEPGPHPTPTPMPNPKLVPTILFPKTPGNPVTRPPITIPIIPIIVTPGTPTLPPTVTPTLPPTTTPVTTPNPGWLAPVAGAIGEGFVTAISFPFILFVDMDEYLKEDNGIFDPHSRQYQ